MGKKRIYRAVSVNELGAAKVEERLNGHCRCVAIDVAKEDMFAVFVKEDGQVAITVKWKHPVESRRFIELVTSVAGDARAFGIVMEPSGTFGDALRSAFIQRSFEVFRVNPKHTFDAMEIYDGVPSLHDAKSAAIIAKLHLDERSTPWPVNSERQRSLTASVRVLQLHEERFQQNRNRIFNLLMRHWPELLELLALGSATLLELVKVYGGPMQVLADPDGAAELMSRTSRKLVSHEKIAEVIASAETTLGLPMVEEEVRMIRCIATEARRDFREAQLARKHVERLSGAEGATKHLAPTIGKVTAAVVVATVGDPTDFDSAKAFLKATGSNLKEKSSGKAHGLLHITKRGPSIARYYLYLAALRLIYNDPIVAAWYGQKVRRQGGQQKTKAVVAVMRKLTLALWHVAQGHTFDASKLFDTRRLNVA